MTWNHNLQPVLLLHWTHTWPLVYLILLGLLFVEVVVFIVVSLVVVLANVVLFSLDVVKLGVAWELDEAVFESVELTSDWFNSQIEHFYKIRI